MSSIPENYAETMAAAFEDEMKKIAEVKVAKMSPGALKTIGLIGAGALGYETLRRAERDRRLGRGMRIQQGAY